VRSFISDCEQVKISHVERCEKVEKSQESSLLKCVVWNDYVADQWGILPVTLVEILKNWAYYECVMCNDYLADIWEISVAVGKRRLKNTVLDYMMALKDDMWRAKVPYVYMYINVWHMKMCRYIYVCAYIYIYIWASGVWNTRCSTIWWRSRMTCGVLT